MAGIVDKMRALDANLGLWYRAKPTTWINIEGRYLLYNALTNRLVLDDVIVLFENDGTAKLKNKAYKFSQIDGDVWHLTRRPLTKMKGNEPR